MITLGLLSVVIAIIGNIFLGLFTFRKNTKSATNRLFLVFTFAIAVYLLFNNFAQHQANDAATLFWIRNVMSVALFINVSFFLLVKAFPDNMLKINRTSLILMVLGTLALLPITRLPLLFTSVTPGTIQPNPGPAMPLFVLHTIFFIGGGFVILIRKHRRMTGVQNTQIKLFLLGAYLMFLLIVLTNLLIVIIFSNTLLVGLLPLYTLTFVGFVSYAIVKHRFLDIRLIIARSVAYLVLTIFLVFLYVVAFSIIGTYVSGIQANTNSLIVSGILALGIAASLGLLRKPFERMTNRIFYRESYDSHEILGQLTNIMASTLELEDLVGRVLDETISEMKISYGAIALLYSPEDNLSPIGWLTRGSPEGRINLRSSEMNKLAKSSISSRRKEKLLVFEELTESRVKKIMRSHDLSIFLPLIVENEVIGAMTLGHKSSGDIYSSQDIRVLQILAPEFAIAVKNALSYEEIRQFNITLRKEIRRATKKLRDANKRLKELDTLKDEFVSIASHELRTPMTSIKSYLWMVLNKADKPVSEKVRRYVEIAYNSTERLIALVQDMLTVSRIEGKRLEVKFEKFDLYKVAEQVYSVLRVQAKGKNIKFQLNGKSRKYYVKGDKDKIGEVLQNVVGNALKFTPSGGTVEVTFAKQTDEVLVDIKDTGPGISKEDLPKLFQKFGRLEKPYKNLSKTSGTGLGLYISQQIITLHKGKITVDSKLGKGTTFHITLPEYGRR